MDSLNNDLFDLLKKNNLKETLEETEEKDDNQCISCKKIL